MSCPVGSITPVRPPTAAGVLIKVVQEKLFKIVP
jgi:hypothetical protein